MKRNKLLDLLLDEVSLVDKGMNQEAKVVLFKRGNTNPLRDALIKVSKHFLDDASTDFTEELRDETRGQKLDTVMSELWPLIDALRDSLAASVVDLEATARDEKIIENVDAFLTSVQAIPAKVEELTKSGVDQDEATEQVFDETLKTLQKAGSSGDNTSNYEEGLMDLKELEKRLGESEQKIAQLEKAATDANIEFETDDDGNITKAVAKSADNQDSALEEAIKAEGFTVIEKDDGTIEVSKAAPVDDEYIEIDGERVLKSSVPEPILKRMEAQQKDLDELKKAREQEDLAKRAEAELPDLSGESVEKAALIRAVDSMPEDHREGVMKILKAANAATSKLFKEFGSSEEDDANSVESQLEKMAEDKVANGEADDIVKARAMVAKSKEGRALRFEKRQQH